MILSNKGLKQKEKWEDKGYALFSYDRETIAKNTLKKPQWVHFGAGNIFRAFPAHLAQKLIELDKMETGIIAAEGYDMEIIDKVYSPYDNLSILATMQRDGSIAKTIIASVSESLHLALTHEDYAHIQTIFQSPTLQIVTFTITEKGYQLYDGQGLPFVAIQKDFALGPMHVESYMGKIAALLYTRYLAGKLPIAMVSLDNCSHNGDKLLQAICEFAQAWVEYEYVEAAFLDYIKDEHLVSFPITMIDKITPRPSDVVIQQLSEDGVVDIMPIKTSKGSYVAPFVNAESAEYLVIEDKFPNGRPDLAAVGVFFGNREVVDQVERMKVCTCLNPLHTTLAIFGCLFNYTTIYACMQDAILYELIEKVGYVEGLPVVCDPKIIHPKAFLDEVMKERLMNPFMPDTPQRIATDTSLKLAIRFLETIQAYQNASILHVEDLHFIPLVLAGWCRYTLGIDDYGIPFSCSDDPFLAWTQEMLKDVELGKVVDVHAVLKPILSNPQIFPIDLYECSIADKVESYFSAMIQGKGAVRRTLSSVLKRNASL